MSMRRSKRTVGGSWRTSRARRQSEAGPEQRNIANWGSGTFVPGAGEKSNARVEDVRLRAVVALRENSFAGWAGVILARL